MLAWMICQSFCLLIDMHISSARAGGLTQAERDAASHLADTIEWSAQPDRITASTHPLALQTLSIEIQEQKNQRSDARALVYQFHYDLQATRVLLIDPAQSRLIKKQLIDSVHLPLNTHEIQFASTLLSQQDTIVEQLREEQRRRGRLAFDSLIDLDVKASIFEPLNNTHPCAVQRCALMSLFDDTRTVFSIEPIINLQTREVMLLATQ